MTKKDNNELANSNQAFLIYQDDNGITQVNVRFEGEDVWLSVELIMQLFDASQQDVSYHIGQIYAEGEQDKERTNKKFLLVRQEENKTTGGKGLSDMRKQNKKPLPSSRNIAKWRCCNTKVTTTGPSEN